MITILRFSILFGGTKKTPEVAILLDQTSSFRATKIFISNDKVWDSFTENVYVPFYPTWFCLGQTVKLKECHHICSDKKKNKSIRWWTTTEWSEIDDRRFAVIKKRIRFRFFFSSLLDKQNGRVYQLLSVCRVSCPNTHVHTHTHTPRNLSQNIAKASNNVTCVYRKNETDTKLSAASSTFSLDYRAKFGEGKRGR